MPLYELNGKIVFFVHVPKTGGGTIENRIRLLGAREALRSSHRRGFSEVSPQHMHAALHHAFVPRSFYDYGFMVVRHPLDRLLSEYKWRKRLTKQPEFASFEKWATRHLRDYPADTNMLDNHMRPQSEFMSDGIEWFKLEDGLEAPVLKALSFLGVDGLEKPLVNMKVSNQTQVTISNELLAAAIAFYSPDFDTFGYDRRKLPAGLTVGGEPFRESLSKRIKMRFKDLLKGRNPGTP